MLESFAIANRYDRLLSHYQSQSPLSLLNARKLAPPHPLGLIAFARLAKKLCRQTGGIFDVTVAPLIAQLKRGDEAGAQRWAKAHQQVSCNAITIDREKIVLPAGITMDPGGLGKGVALDAIVSHLRSASVERAFIDFGGSSFYGLGGPWKVGLQGARGVGVAEIVQLHNAALSSSKTVVGDRPHLVDPRTGRWVVRKRRAAVRAPSAAVAEAFSTALAIAPEAVELPKGTKSWIDSAPRR